MDMATGSQRSCIAVVNRWPADIKSLWKSLLSVLRAREAEGLQRHIGKITTASDQAGQPSYPFVGFTAARACVSYGESLARHTRREEATIGSFGRAA